MARHIDSYEDEWAATLQDPERMLRFRSFVNAPHAADPSVARVADGRGQTRPADAAERVQLAGATIPVRTR
jgi:nitrite reductase (NADH) large subunit